MIPDALRMALTEGAWSFWTGVALLALWSAYALVGRYLGGLERLADEGER